ncbi:hypothetical protein INR49_011848 [Caranx melampygus]|nr:hypothetical protein INR49_011848 [Caranx melampygus]
MLSDWNRDPSSAHCTSSNAPCLHHRPHPPDLLTLRDKGDGRSSCQTCCSHSLCQLREREREKEGREKKLSRAREK